MLQQTKILAVSAVLALPLAACSDTTGPESQVDVTVSFVSVAPSAAMGVVAPGPMRAVDVPGSNGTLAIDEVQIVVDEFKLKRAEGACDGGAEGEDCARFEAPPYFLDLPLDATPVDIAALGVPEATYVELKLETKDLDSAGEEDQSEVASLAAQVVSTFPDWPAAASLRVAGAFDPGDGSAAREFVVYFHAEVKVEMTFDAPMTVVAGDETTSITVEVDPTAWFTLSDGSVMDLSEFDFGSTGDVVEFEAKMSDGFTKIEVDG